MNNSRMSLGRVGGGRLFVGRGPHARSRYGQLRSEASDALVSGSLVFLPL